MCCICNYTWKSTTTTTIKEIKYAEALIEFSANRSLTFDQALSDVQRGYYPSESLEKYILETDFFQGRYYASEDNLLEALRERGSRDPAQALEELRPIRTYMQALSSGDMSEDVINELFRASRGENVNIEKLFKGGFELITNRNMRDILSTDLPDSLRGKVTWIANATFESTQFGSQIDADAKEALDALNADRAAKNLKPIPEKDFVARFSYGGYEAELIELNKTTPFAAAELLLKLKE